MDQEEMEKILAHLVEIDPRIKELTFDFADDDNIRLEASSGANLDALAKLAVNFPQGRLPPSYAQLLLLHNGIKNFKYVDESLLSAEDLLRLGDDGRTQREAQKEPHMIFFIFGPGWNGVAFDRRTVRPDGEMEVAEFDKTGETNRWPSLDDFLRWYLASQEEQYKKVLADRKNLEDT